MAREHDINEIINVHVNNLSAIRTYKKLRNLIAKGPNYREQNNIDWDLCHKLCMDGINKYRKRWAIREKVALSMNGHVMLKKPFLIRYDNYGCAHKKEGKFLRDGKCKQALTDLHELYVLVPADKAGTNVVVACKHYYKEVLTKELKSSDGASTYVGKDECADEIIEGLC